MPHDRYLTLESGGVHKVGHGRCVGPSWGMKRHPAPNTMVLVVVLATGFRERHYGSIASSSTIFLKDIARHARICMLHTLENWPTFSLITSVDAKHMNKPEAMTHLAQDSVLERYLGHRRTRPLTCLGDVAELEVSPLSAFDAAMPADHPQRQLPRKWWEWDYIAACAEQLELLRPTSTALGLGCGNEPLIFYFANYCQRVIATDLYSSDTNWREARFSTLRAVLASSPIPFPHEHVDILNADMRNTGVDDASIDFIWSCSSIEHVHSISDVVQIFSEIDRVLKPGGYAILTTEFAITENPYLLPGVNAWSVDLLPLLKTCFSQYEWIGVEDVGFNWRHPGNTARPRRYLPLSSLGRLTRRFPYNRRAGTLANPVGLSVIVPIGFVVRKPATAAAAGITPWDRLPVSPLIRCFDAGITAFAENRNSDCVASLDTVCTDVDADRQLAHLAFRFSIDARARLGEMQDRAAFEDRILNFLDRWMPPGVVQDADCLDICGYLLGELGNTVEGLTIYEKCLLSPSTSRGHVFELLIRYLEAADVNDQRARAEAFAEEILLDLAALGLSDHEYTIEFANVLRKRKRLKNLEKFVKYLAKRLCL